MKRISPEDVVAAYLETGISPTSVAHFMPSSGKVTHADIIGVLICRLNDISRGGNVWKSTERLELDPGYRIGLWCGFAGFPWNLEKYVRGNDPAMVELGWHDGRAAALVVAFCKEILR